MQEISPQIYLPDIDARGVLLTPSARCGYAARNASSRKKVLTDGEKGDEGMNVVRAAMGVFAVALVLAFSGAEAAEVNLSEILQDPDSCQSTEADAMVVSGTDAGIQKPLMLALPFPSCSQIICTSHADCESCFGFCSRLPGPGRCIEI